MATLTIVSMSKSAVGACAAAMLMLIQLAMAANYTVGGSNGSWDTTSGLQTWASSQKFHVGDNLLFQYTANHNLMEVSKADYDSCQVSNGRQSYSDGNTAISLSSPGKRYFICGMPGHCLQGMKVEIDTLAATASSTKAPASAPTPTSITSVPAAPAPVPESQAPAISRASSGSPLTSPSLSPATVPSDAPSAESPVPTTSSIPPQPSPSASSASKGSFSRILAFGFILIARLMQSAF